MRSIESIANMGGLHSLTPAAICDYGTRTKSQLELYQIPLRRGEVDDNQLHLAMVKGNKELRQLLKSCPSNKGKDTEIDSLELIDL